jgi:hypothetical protein
MEFQEAAKAMEEFGNKLRAIQQAYVEKRVKEGASVTQANTEYFALMR